jgi:hypothetical protein
MDGKLLVVPAGSLDTDLEIEMITTGHIFLNEKANLDNNLEKISHYDELPKRNE